MQRKLEVGETLSEVFDIYREHAGVLLPLAFWLFLPVAIVGGIGVDEGFGPVYYVSMVLSIVVGLIYQGMVVSLVRDVQDGRRDSSVGQLFESVAPVLGTLLVASIVFGAATAIGFFLLIVPGCILVTIWAVIPPAIVIERQSVFGSARRSRRLVEGYGWPVFGAVISAALITFVVTLVLSAIGGAIASGPIVRIVFAALASTVAAPIGALVAGVLYYKLLALKGESARGADAPATQEGPVGPSY